MKSIINICLLLVSILLVSCQPSPKPIEYGSDICHHCKMSIVDKKFASQAVTSKGKVYNFDAIECLVQYAEQNMETEFAFLQVNSYLEPENRLNVEECYFVKSPEIPSPMGGYLSAYQDKNTAESQAQHPQAQVMDWQGLQKEVD